MPAGEAHRPRHRLFVAFDLPPHLARTIDVLPQDLEGARWVPPSNRHLTLRFIGEVASERRDSIRRTLAQIRAHQMALSVTGLTVLPSYRAPRVLALAISNIPALIELQQNVENVLQDLGLSPETKPFRPHITLARLKRANPSDVRRYVTTYEPSVDGSFQADRFVLYESRQGVDGHEYEALETYPLN